MVSTRCGGGEGGGGEGGGTGGGEGRGGDGEAEGGGEGVSINAPVMHSLASLQFPLVHVPTATPGPAPWSDAPHWPNGVPARLQPPAVQKP